MAIKASKVPDLFLLGVRVKFKRLVLHSDVLLRKNFSEDCWILLPVNVYLSISFPKITYVKLTPLTWLIKHGSKFYDMLE